MSEVIRRSREIKKEEQNRQILTEQAEPVEQIDQGRRFALGAIGKAVIGGAALTMAPSIVKLDAALAANPERMSVAEKEAFLDARFATFKRDADTPDMRDAIQGKGRNPMARLLSVMKQSIDPELLKGTKYDARTVREQYCVQLAYGTGTDGERRVSFRTARPGSRPPVTGSCANGFFVRKDRFVTAQHVYDAMRGLPKEKTARDLTILKPPPDMEAQPDQVVRLDPSLTDDLIHRSPVFVEGIQPSRDGKKIFQEYAGEAVCMTRGMVEKEFPKDTEPYLIEQFAHSFMIRLPPGEARNAPGENVPRARGMSGSKVWMLHNGVLTLAGEFFAVSTCRNPITGQEDDVGFFHPVSEIIKRIDMLNRTGA